MRHALLAILAALMMAAPAASAEEGFLELMGAYLGRVSQQPVEVPTAEQVYALAGGYVAADSSMVVIEYQLSPDVLLAFLNPDIVEQMKADTLESFRPLAQQFSDEICSRDIVCWFRFMSGAQPVADFRLCCSDFFPTPVDDTDENP